jgi:radical SAM superfamily enzyme YgiQ (UPF0313 family)
MNVLLVQLPIPPPGPVAVGAGEEITVALPKGTVPFSSDENWDSPPRIDSPAPEGNVPLAAAYLKLYARRQGLEKSYDIDLLPSSLANTLGDQGLVEEILARRPWMVGFSCYVWNIERTLWIARQLKQRQPELKVLIGGPEITPDNAWALQQPAVDYAVVGEGEPAFADLLAALAAGNPAPQRVIADQSATTGRGFVLDDVSSPYVEGILDASDGRMLLETVRGCRFRCKYCYYPKNHAVPRFLSSEQIVANLRHAAQRGATEVVLLDPTLNQRPDFADFLRLLAQNNAQGQLAFSGELRAEGIDGPTARLLRAANFHEVEIGLQSVEPRAWELMGRPTNLAAFERGVHALLDEGIKVQVDLILGLPGDTVDSIRRGIDFLNRTRAYSEVQVFNLSILPGTAFRHEADSLGLTYQPWPPYYVLKTPALDVQRMYQLMEEAQEAFGIEFDPLPPPRLDFLDQQSRPCRGCRVDIDTLELQEKSLAEESCSGSALCYTLWLRSADFQQRRQEAAAIIGRLLTDNPHTTLQVILEPTAAPDRLTVETLDLLMAACYRTPTYLDRYYSLHPGRLLGSKRLFVLLPAKLRAGSADIWQRRIANHATLLWHGDANAE